MKIKLTGVPITDQEHALAFYTEKLGFVKKDDMEVAPGHRFLTVVSPEDPDGAALMLEPSGAHPATKAWKTALYSEGIPVTAFKVDDITAEHERLTAAGVQFKGGISDMPGSKVAMLDDTCGNWVMIYEETASGQP